VTLGEFGHPQERLVKVCDGLGQPSLRLKRQADVVVDLIIINDPTMG